VLLKLLVTFSRKNHKILSLISRANLFLPTKNIQNNEKKKKCRALTVFFYITTIALKLNLLIKRLTFPNYVKCQENFRCFKKTDRKFSSVLRKLHLKPFKHVLNRQVCLSHQNQVQSNSVITNSSGPAIFVRYNRGSL
jgi:hypothetical protein